MHDNISVQSWERQYKVKYLASENVIYANGNIKTIPMHISKNCDILFDFVGGFNKESDELGRVKMADADVKNPFIAVLNPVEVPFMFNSYFGLEFIEAREIRVRPFMIITKKVLESYITMDRDCFYSYEIELSMFKRDSHKTVSQRLFSTTLQMCPFLLTSAQQFRPCLHKRLFWDCVM